MLALACTLDFTPEWMRAERAHNRTTIAAGITQQDHTLRTKVYAA
jgi:hypothetical protein